MLEPQLWILNRLSDQHDAFWCDRLYQLESCARLWCSAGRLFSASSISRPPFTPHPHLQPLPCQCFSSEKRRGRISGLGRSLDNHQSFLPNNMAFLIRLEPMTGEGFLTWSSGSRQETIDRPGRTWYGLF